MNAFEIEVELEVDPQEWIEFGVGGKTCRALATPTGGQVAYITMMTRRLQKEGETDSNVASMLNFIDSFFDEETHDYLLDLLLDTKVKFGPEHLLKILENLTERWSGNPTQLPSDSSTSPPTSGTSSVPPTPESTWSDSPFIASAP